MLRPEERPVVLVKRVLPARSVTATKFYDALEAELLLFSARVKCFCLRLTKKKFIEEKECSL
jgi:hypothetical protein